MTRWWTALDLSVQPMSDYAADAALEGLGGGEGLAGMDSIESSDPAAGMPVAA
jgi:hypothetical protein